MKHAGLDGEATVSRTGTTADPLKSWLSRNGFDSDDSLLLMLQVILKVLTYEIQYHDHDLSIAALLRIVGGLLFFACIFPAYYSLSRPYRAKMDGRGIMGAIAGVMANVIQRLALHFFNTFLFLNQEFFFSRSSSPDLFQPPND